MMASPLVPFHFEVAWKFWPRMKRIWTGYYCMWRNGQLKTVPPARKRCPAREKTPFSNPANPEYFQDLLWAHSFHNPRFRTAWILCLYTREKSLHSMIIHARRNGSTVRRPRYWLCCALPVGRGSRRAQWCCQALLLLSSFTWHVPVMCRETLWAWACLPANSVCSAGICQCCLLYKSQFRHGPC